MKINNFTKEISSVGKKLTNFLVVLYSKPTWGTAIMKIFPWFSSVHQSEC